MSTAHRADLVVDQGQDEFWEFYWTTGENRPFSVQAPMRMEIRNAVGGVALTLQTNDTSQDLENDLDHQQILYNSESGMVQLQISANATAALAPGEYDYDLFVHYSSPPKNFVRLRRLLAGKVYVNGRITRNI